MRWTQSLGVLGVCTLAGAVIAQPVHEWLGDGVVRSFASTAARDSAEPSVALVADPPAAGGPPAGFSPLPAFDVRGGLQTVVIAIDEGTNLYATGHQSGPMERTGRRVEYYNLDNFAWNDASNRNYQTHPWVLGVRADGSAFGVLFDSTWASSLDLERPAVDGIVFQTEGPAPRVVTVNAGTPQGVVSKLAELTGYPFMPPMWSVGYHQSKYSYFPQQNVLDVAGEFRSRQIPAEVIWMDIDYMDGFRNFTVNPSAFPDPAGLNAALDAIGFQAVWMANCGIKVDGGYDAYTQMNAQGLAVQNPSGFEFRGDVWPGLSVWPDFTMATTRDWWAGRIESFASIGIDGIWNDMNEPAVFNVASKTMPDNNWHRADADLGGPNIHRKYHNIYGMQMSRATREGMLRAFPGRRPFVLTRAGYIGGQRYAAMWTGDNVADWYHVDVSIQNIINMGLSGQPNAGPDIGGFNGDSGAEMYARWMGMGALMPFARGHYGFASRDREPWSYGSATENTSRLALNRRYRLLNYLYTQFYDAHTAGLPVARPLFFAEPANPALREWDDGFLIGPGLLVVGATKPGAVPQIPPTETPVYEFDFPAQNTPGFVRDSDDPDQPGLYVLGGHIVVANNLVQHSRELTPRRDEPLELIIGLDEQGLASGVLYEDDGDGWAFQTGGYTRTTFEAERSGNQVTVRVGSIEGGLAPQDRPIDIRVMLGDRIWSAASTSLHALPVTFQIGEPVPDAQPDLALRDGRLIGQSYANGPIATNARDRYSEISQLRALYARPVDGGVEIGIEGELAIDGTAIAVFFDSQSGGQNTVNTSSLNPPPAGLQALTGTQLETGFAADRLLFMNGFEGSVFCDWVTLQSGSNGSKTYLGRQFMGSGDSNLIQGTDNLGIEVALGTAGHAAGSGFEIFVPSSQLGTGTGPLGQIKIFACIVKGNGQITNQILPEALDPWPGFAPDFPAIPGQQYASVLTAPDLNGDGALDFFDVIEAIERVNESDGSMDLAPPIGVIDAADLLEYIRGSSHAE